MNKYISALLLSGLLLLSTGCGGGSGDGSSSPTTTEADSVPLTTEETEALSNLLPDMNTHSATDNTQLIATTARDAKVEYTPIGDGKSTEIPLSTFISGSFEDGILLNDASGISDVDVGKALFIDNIFRGMIDKVSKSGDNVSVELVEAKDFTDVYSTLDIDIQNDAFKKSIQRAINSKVNFGKYDSINKNPLKVSLIDSSSTTRSLKDDELILRIDIPAGYTMPRKATRAVECSDWDLENDVCSTIDDEISKKLDADLSLTAGNITFSSEGSYIEIGLGAKIKLVYDYHLIGASDYYVEGEVSKYYKLNLQANFSASMPEPSNSNLSFDEDLDFLNGGLFISIPTPSGVQVGVNIFPSFRYGGKMGLDGTFSYSKTIGDGGAVQFMYDSISGENYNREVDKEFENAEGTYSAGIEASGYIYVFPNITFVPSIGHSAISARIDIANFRVGTKVEGAISSKIDGEFNLINDGELEDKYGAEAKISLDRSNILELEWDFTVAGHQVFESQTLTITADSVNLFEWKAGLLKDPKIIFENKSDDSSKILVTFQSEDDPDIQKHISYFYSRGYVVPAQDIPIIDIGEHPLVWKKGDESIVIEEGETIKVRSAVWNKDTVAEDKNREWAFGMSISQQVEKSSALECPIMYNIGSITNPSSLYRTVGKEDSTPLNYFVCHYDGSYGAYDGWSQGNKTLGETWEFKDDKLQAYRDGYYNTDTTNNETMFEREILYDANGIVELKNIYKYPYNTLHKKYTYYLGGVYYKNKLTYWTNSTDLYKVTNYWYNPSNSIIKNSIKNYRLYKNGTVSGHEVNFDYGVSIDGSADNHIEDYKSIEVDIATIKEI